MANHIFDKQRLLNCKSEDEFNLCLPNHKEFILNILKNDDIIMFKNLIHDIHTEFLDILHSILILIDHYIENIPFKIIFYLISYFNRPINNLGIVSNSDSHFNINIYILMNSDKFTTIQKENIGYLLYKIQNVKLEEYNYFKHLNEQFSDNKYDHILEIVMKDFSHINNLCDVNHKHEKKLLLLNKEEILYESIYNEWYSSLIYNILDNAFED